MESLSVNKFSDQKHFKINDALQTQERQMRERKMAYNMSEKIAGQQPLALFLLLWCLFVLKMVSNLFL